MYVTQSFRVDDEDDKYSSRIESTGNVDLIVDGRDHTVAGQSVEPTQIGRCKEMGNGACCGR